MSSSIWWPTPVRPSTWFSDDELAASRAYSHPLRRAAGFRLVLRAFLLLAAHLVLVDLSPDRSLAGVLVVAVPLVVLAWWLPATLVDSWFEFSHEPRFGHQSLPPHQFVVGSVAAALPLLLVVGSIAAIGYFLMDRTSVWSVGLAAAVVLVFVALGRLDPAARSLGGTLRPVEGAVADRLAGLADRAQAGDVGFATVDAEVLPGLNALSTRDQGRQRIVLSSELLETESELLEHVVAHELAHLHHGHLAVTRWLTTLLVAVCMWLLGPLAAWAWLFRSTKVSDSADPRGLVVFFVVVALMTLGAGLFLAWVGRAHERKADESAFGLAGAVRLPVVRALHVTHRADLEPGVLSRLISSHPPPAERLHRASRMTSHRVPSDS